MLWLRPTTGLPALVRLGIKPLAAALLATGCAASPGSEVARLETRSVLEADGLPAQVHPAADIRQLPDDPSEPFSPQYGSRPIPLVPRAGPPALDAEAIIAAAITAHEMRKP